MSKERGIFRLKVVRVTILMTAICIGALALACGTSAPSENQESVNSPSVSGPQSKSSAAQSTQTSPSPVTPQTQLLDRVTVAIPHDPGSPLNIYVTTHSRFDFLVGLVYEKLFSPSPYVENPEPWLAESITQIDPLTWQVKLRSGIKWHDGEPFTADDVKFTFEWFQIGPPNRYTHHTNNVPDIVQIVAEDAQTLRFVCSYPCPFLGRITLADLPILPEHIWKNMVEPQQYTELPIGTGPYRLVEYQSDKFLKFKANEEHFKGRPLVDELVMPIIKDPSSAFTALKTGEVDVVARGVLPELLPEFQSQSQIDVVSTSPLSLVEIRLNYERPPFDQPRFRQALSLAIDRQALVDTVLLGQGRPGTQGYPHPDSPWTNPDLSTPFDPGQSREILDQMGFIDRDGDGVRETEDGAPLDFSLKVASTEPTWVRAAEMLTTQFSQVGINMSVETADPGTLSGLFRSRDFDLYINDITPHGVADPDQFIMSHRSGYLWKQGLAYPEWDSLFEEYLQTETVADRTAVIFRMQELFNQQPTAIVLWYPQENWAFRKDTFNRWAESPGYGIVHKWSLMSPEARGGTITQEFK